MARGDQQAQGASGQANSNANAFMANSNQLYNNLAPTLQSQAANPQGYSPSDMAALETGAQQSAGGSEAAAVGQGGLLAARTRNAGAPARAVSDAARGAGETLSRGLLGVRTANADMKQGQRDSALRGLGSLYGTNVGAQGEALGNVAKNVDANNAAVKNSWAWATDILDPALSAGATAVGGLRGGGKSQ